MFFILKCLAKVVSSLQNHDNFMIHYYFLQPASSKVIIRSLLRILRTHFAQVRNIFPDTGNTVTSVAFFPDTSTQELGRIQPKPKNRQAPASIAATPAIQNNLHRKRLTQCFKKFWRCNKRPLLIVRALTHQIDIVA